jgi:methyltransferase (TIGR00027 family)
MAEHQQWDIVTGVGITALGVAAGRALETQRASGLVADPYADSFVEAAGAPVPMPRRLADLENGTWYAETVWKPMTDYVGVRSRFFDDYFARATAAGADQVVLLAAGLDTRAFRLDWPAGTALFEVDQPKVLEFKDAVLDGHGARPGCDRRTVPVDLREDWPAALRAAGFDSSRPTAWLAEGLLPYLPADAERSLFERISRLSAAGSWLAIEYVGDDARSAFDDPAFRDAADQLGVDLTMLWHTEGKDDPRRLLVDHGWTVRTDPILEVVRGYRRELTGPMARTMDAAAFLVAQR